jgi:hypothetical protein
MNLGQIHHKASHPIIDARKDYKTTGIAILDSVAANELKTAEEKVHDQEIRNNEEKDVIEHLVHEKEKEESENKKVSKNLDEAKNELQKLKSEAEKFKSEAA